MMRTIGRVGLALLAGGALAACRTGEAAEEGPAIQTAEAVRGDLTIQAEATGTVEPIRSVEVKSKASGEVLRLHADVGDDVSAGALLAEVDPRDVRNGFDQAEADLEVARARVEIAQAQLRRSEQLVESGVITEQEHEGTRLEYANAQAALVRAETNYELADLRLGDVTIRAPLAGTIIQKNVEEGQIIQSASQNVSGGTTLFVMANLAQMQVRTLVDETDMGDIRAGLSATVRVEAFPDRTFRGVVEKIEPQAVVEQNVTMFPVIVNLDNRAGLLKPGMNAEVNVLVDQATDVLLVPNGAVVQMQDIQPAAMVLGVELGDFDARAALRGARGGGRAGAAAGPDGRSAAGEAGAEAPGGDASSREAPGGEPRGGEATDPRARFAELRAQVERGEISQDSLRSVMQAMRAQGGLAGARGGAMGAPGAGAGGAPARNTQPAAVFVMGASGEPELRLVQIGLSDWDYTQVVSGLEEGETLAVVGAAQLQARQQEFLNNMRNRMGGSPFGRGR